jgi:hypothetical protein
VEPVAVMWLANVLTAYKWMLKDMDENQLLPSGASSVDMSAVCGFHLI